MNFQNFTETDIPYEILAEFGLTQNMIDDLPQSVMLAFLSGRTTPVLPIKIKDFEGKFRTTNARVGLTRKQDEDGQSFVDVIFVPIWDDKDLSEFGDYERQQLMMGNVVLTTDNNNESIYAQFDECINQVMAVPADLIKHNLDTLIDTVKISVSDREALYEGKIVEVNDENNEPVSFGIDLLSPQCFRVTSGDALAWKQEKEYNLLNEYNFGIYGCWKRDEKNHLSYIPEEEYTESMLDEMSRAGLQNAANSQMRGRR